MIITNQKLRKPIMLNFLHEKMEGKFDDSVKWEVAVNAIAMARRDYGKGHLTIEEIKSTFNEEVRSNTALIKAGVTGKAFEIDYEDGAFNRIVNRIYKINKHYRHYMYGEKRKEKWEKAVRKYNDEAKTKVHEIVEPYENQDSAMKLLADVLYRPVERVELAFNDVMKMISTVFKDYPEFDGTFNDRFRSIVAWIIIEINTNKDFFGSLYGYPDEFIVEERDNIVLIDYIDRKVDMAAFLSKIVDIPEYAKNNIVAKSYLDDDVYVSVKYINLYNIPRYFFTRALREIGVDASITHVYYIPGLPYNNHGLAIKGKFEYIKSKLTEISDVLGRLFEANTTKDFSGFTTEAKIHYVPEEDEWYDDLGIRISYADITR